MGNLFVVSRCAVHPDHFHIRAASDEAGETYVEIHSPELARTVDDLEQIRFNKELPLTE